MRVHAPDTVSALVIPPESRIRRGTVVDRLYGSTDKQEEVRVARPGLERKAALWRIAREFGCTSDDVAEAQGEIDRGYPLCGQPVPGGGGLLQGESPGHGPGLLNRAAYHACALVPEPSCAYGNMLLDRTSGGGCERSGGGPLREGDR